MTNYSPIKLFAVEDLNLPERTIVLPSKIYANCKDTKQLLYRLPVIRRDAILSDINIIESSTIDDEICLVSKDILVAVGGDFNGDILNLIDEISNDDVEMLEDMIMLAMNDAVKKANADKEQRLGKYGQGLTGLM